MVIVLAIVKWRHYLLGRRFVIKTDQQSLKFIMEQREVGHEYQRWVRGYTFKDGRWVTNIKDGLGPLKFIMELMGYTFDIQYRPGATN